METVTFENFIGQEHIKTHFKEAGSSDKTGHAYILEGMKGSGKRTLAKLFAMTLLCEAGDNKPCMQCHSCKMALSEGHPDIITVTHEKPAVISVDEIRRQVVGDVLIRPYYGKKKIYIIPDAEKMNVNAQNSLLKTIEEPPDFAVLLLLTDSRQSLLPTINSRCVYFALRQLSNADVGDYLMTKKGIPEKEARVFASLSQGSIGRAMEISESEEFIKDYEETISFLKRSKDMPVSEILGFAKELAGNKENIGTITDIILLWYRDILMCKAAGRAVSLTFVNETEYIEQKARQSEYEDLNKVFLSLDALKERLKANAGTEASMDMLLLGL